MSKWFKKLLIFTIKSKFNLYDNCFVHKPFHYLIKLKTVQKRKPSIVTKLNLIWFYALTPYIVGSSNIAVISGLESISREEQKCLITTSSTVLLNQVWSEQYIFKRFIPIEHSLKKMIGTISFQKNLQLFWDLNQCP